MDSWSCAKQKAVVQSYFSIVQSLVNDIIPIKAVCVIYRIMSDILKETHPHTHTPRHTSTHALAQVKAGERVVGKLTEASRSQGEGKSKYDHSTLYVHMELSRKYFIFFKGDCFTSKPCLSIKEFMSY